jgi:hypothetical protein
VVIIEEKYLERLRAAGLFVSPPNPPDHALPDAVRVGKPTSTKGNTIKEYETGYEDVDMDAPMLWFFFTGEVWGVWSQECAPKMGPGDFENLWKTPEEAVDDILDLYLGNPARMAAKEAAKPRC